jgi:hypothetical protein
VFIDEVSGAGGYFIKEESEIIPFKKLDLATDCAH